MWESKHLQLAKLAPKPIKKKNKTVKRELGSGREGMTRFQQAQNTYSTKWNSPPKEKEDPSWVSKY